MAPPGHPLLAQAVQPAQPHGNTLPSSVFVWVIVLIAVIMVGGVVLVWLRRRILASEQSEHAGGLMESLRRMRDSGQMSQQEYDATRKAMAARLAGTRPAAPAPTAPKKIPESR